MAASLKKRKGPPQVGDVLVRGGSPGHVVMVLAVAKSLTGRTRVMLGQGFMPAQQFHVLRSMDGLAWWSGAADPWFDAAGLDRPEGLKTLTYKPFYRRDLRRW